ncbi:hypothetical protein NE237_007595 [Protea cynaroides]|uniref:3-hydroxyacyl-CoA dehydrogenase NAD binding domain-containing protein n=1 Tax=Protea cynaroides TaxID=273540 RepID=A0A9Q0KQJ7_9MAGN|nr:hypothetical protein NE237_007595 [Protea cynaroides]
MVEHYETKFEQLLAKVGPLLQTKYGSSSPVKRSTVSIVAAAIITDQIPGVADGALAPKRVNKVAILGGGLMGFGMATALILCNCPVILKEVNEKFLEGGIGRVKANLSISGVTVDPKLMKSTDKDILVIFSPVVNKACRVLDEEIAVKASDLEMTAVMGEG